MLTCLEPVFVTDLLHSFISIRISCKLSVVSSFAKIGLIVHDLLVFGLIHFSKVLEVICGNESKGSEDKLTGLIHYNLNLIIVNGSNYIILKTIEKLL